MLRVAAHNPVFQAYTKGNAAEATSTEPADGQPLAQGQLANLVTQLVENSRRYRRWADTAKLAWHDVNGCQSECAAIVRLGFMMNRPYHATLEGGPHVSDFPLIT
jgi:hypothetical protein